MRKLPDSKRNKDRDWDADAVAKLKKKIDRDYDQSVAEFKLNISETEKRGMLKYVVLIIRLT
jgi:hypothetical protein